MHDRHGQRNQRAVASLRIATVAVAERRGHPIQHWVSETASMRTPETARVRRVFVPAF
jgi:hypothetical protein